MDIKKVDFRKLPFSELFCDYIQEKEGTAPFFLFQHNEKALKQAVENRRFDGDRHVAADILADFNDTFSLDAAARNNLQALRDEQTVTITTGQQPGLFGGPLYTILKAITIIHLARVLSRDTKRRVVPVFWIADEDHDFDEIATVSLPDRNGIKKMVFPRDSTVPHAAGNFNIDSRFESFWSKIYNILPETDFQQELKELMDGCYRPDRTIGEAFGELLARLFSHHGLVLAGSHRRDVKVFTSGYIRRAIEEAEAIHSALSRSSSRIANTYHQQVPVPDSLLFWHDDHHGRVRLKHKNGTWMCNPDTSLTTAELLQKLYNEPERFSPGVFLRPIIQDALLPNAAYAAGPAEIAYYGQMKSIYTLFDLKMPFIAGRLSASLVAPSIEKSLQKLPFDMPDFAKRIEDLEQHYLRNCSNAEPDRHINRWKKRVEELSEKIWDDTGIADPDLIKHGRAITREYINSIDKLHKKMVNRVREKEQVQINRIKKIKSALFPNNRLQEREIAGLYFMNKFGMDIWDRLLQVLSSDHDFLLRQHYKIKL